MRLQTPTLARLLLDSRVTLTPLRVLGELRRRGRRRLPESVHRADGRLARRGAFALLRSWLEGEWITRHRGRWVVNSFLPPFPGAAYERMFTNLLSGRRLSPVSAFLAITVDCPHDCAHCSLRGRVAGRLDTSAWLDVIGQVHRLGASLVGFTGGEPLLRDDLETLVSAAAHGGAETIVFTCGAGLDDARARALARAGLWALAVSVDHPDPAACDRLRGAPGAHARAVAALRAARRAGFYTMIGCVARRELIDGGLLPALHAFARGLGVHELRLVEPMPCGGLARPGPGVLLEPAHVDTLRRFHVETNRRGHPPKVCAFNRVEGPEAFGCGAGTQHLYVDPAGEVCPCDFTPLSFGNATRRSLADIWVRMNAALGNPRRRCFVRTHHALIAAEAGGRFPTPPEASERICALAGMEPMPDFFRSFLPNDNTPLPP